MIVVGNDIVDLRELEAQGKSRDGAFVNRILTPSEKEYLSCRHGDGTLWLLWAAKEAAFKAAGKISPELTFIPRRFAVTIGGPRPSEEEGGNVTMSGRVDTPSVPVYFQAERTVDCIHVLGATHMAALPRVLAEYRLISPQGEKIVAAEVSRQVRHIAVRRISLALGINEDEIEIRRETSSSGALGPPRAYRQDEPLPFDISLSHHGRFVAYALLPR